MSPKQSPKSGTGRKSKSPSKPAKKKRPPRKPTVKKPAPKLRDPARPLKSKKQEAFVLSLFGGMNQSDAFRAHYSTSRMKDKTVHEKASRLASKVGARLEFLKSQVASDRIMTKIELAEMYSDICRTRHSEFLVHSADGVWMHDIGPETLHQAALKKVKTKVVTDQQGKTLIQKQFDEIELESKIAAGKALSDLMGYNAPKKHALTDKTGEKDVAVTVIMDKEAAKAL